MDRQTKARDVAREDVLEDALKQARDEIMLLENRLAILLSSPLSFATVIDSQNEIDPSAFAPNDVVAVVGGELDGKIGRILPRQPVVDDKGRVEVIFADLKKGHYLIGLDGKPQQVRLLGKSDGTSITLCRDGFTYEVRGVFGKKFEPGQTVKVLEGTNQIVEPHGISGAGDVTHVHSVIDELHIEVEVDGKKRVVLCGKSSTEEPIRVNDRVQLDRSNTVVIRRLKSDHSDRFACTEEINVPWDSVGGCEEAKNALIDLVELPFAYPEVYKYYNKKMPKGGLLYGPPGCGKTMLGKATYTSLCSRFGKQAMGSGWIYVKGPELLNMWLGNTEANIRELFIRGQRHFELTGVPAVMFIDEAEAILGERGKHAGGDYERHCVPMFLSEMDGLQASNVVVLLATNRPEMLDPALVRHGRIDRHIKVPRPTINTAAEIFHVHLKGVPLYQTDAKTVVAMTTAEMFSKQYVLYRIVEKVSLNGHQHQKEHIFCLKDAINGAMIASVVEQASNMAMKRDMTNKTRHGVGLEDFAKAVQTVYRGQRDQNHKFDIEDFVDTNKISRCELSYEKMRGDDA